MVDWSLFKIAVFRARYDHFSFVVLVLYLLVAVLVPVNGFEFINYATLRSANA
jgi:hypothetical protein